MGRKTIRYAKRKEKRKARRMDRFSGRHFYCINIASSHSMAWRQAFGDMAGVYLDFWVPERKRTRGAPPYTSRVESIGIGIQN